MIHAVEQQPLGLFLLKCDDQICASHHFTVVSNFVKNKTSPSIAERLIFSVVQCIVIFILKFFPKSIVLLQCNFEYLKVASS